MLKVKSGDLDKLGLLFERYNRRLFNFFYRLTGRHDVSEDLVQGVFERILKYRKSYTDAGAFSTWIFQIARNLHADYYRKAEKEGQQKESVNWESFRAEEDNHRPDFEFDEDHELELLKKALEKLTPDKKEPLILSRFQGFKYREIADILDCTEGAIKVRIFRGLNELKKIVTDLKKRKNYD